MIAITQKQLKEGKVFESETVDKDNIRGCEVFFNKGKFIIFFNGAFISQLKTFSNFKNRLQKLIVKWDLEEFQLQIV